MFASRLRELRELSNLNKKELGDILGIAASTLSGYESGNREPNFDTLKRLANFFNVSTDYLLGLTDNKNNVVKDNKTEEIEEEDKETARVIQELKDKGLNHRDIRRIVSVIKMLNEMRNI